MMNRWILIAMGILVSAVSLAQPPMDISEQKRGQIEAQKVAFITKHLNLTPGEAQAFWPVYNEYKDKQRAIHEESRPEKSLDELSDEEVEQLLDQMIERKEKELQLEKQYMARFRELLPVRKVAKLHVAERRFNAEVIKRLSQHMRERRENLRNRR